TWRQQIVVLEARTGLPRRCVRERGSVPVPDRTRESRWNQCPHGRELLPQRRVAAAVIAMQMRIQKHLQRPSSAAAAHQLDGLLGMRPITTVDHGCTLVSDGPDVA